MPITNLIRDNWCRFQGELFPEIQDAVGPLLKNHQRFVMALGIICPEDFTLRISQRDGRPLCDRINLVRAFIAKAIWDIPTTRDLVERLKVDRQMRNLCGWVLICGKACKDDPLGGKSASNLTHLVWLQKLLFVVQRWKGKRG